MFSNSKFPFVYVNSSFANLLAQQIYVETRLYVHSRRLLANVDVYDQVEEAMARGTVFVLVLKLSGPQKHLATVFLLHETPEGKFLEKCST